MKKITFILVALMVLFVTGSFAQVAKTDSINIKVGFHCANGKALLEKELGKVDGVSYAFANVETKVVTIKYDAAKLNKEKLVGAIEKIGYTTEFSKEDTEIKKACTHDKK
jgi:periplasmic mercuric ion binding protein